MATPVIHAGIRYESMSALANKLGIHRSGVTRACKHREMLRGAYVIPLDRMMAAPIVKDY